jgi:FHA domain
VSSSDDQQSADDGSGQDTSAFPFDLGDELETPSGAAESGMWTEELPTGSALLVVKRGRNAGARFLLNRPVTTAGRLPGSDILLDDVTVSRRHAEFRIEDRQHRRPARARRRCCGTACGSIRAVGVRWSTRSARTGTW